MRGMGVGWLAVLVCVSCESDTKGSAGDGGSSAATGNGGQSAGGMPSAGESGNSGGRITGGGGGSSTGGRAGSAANATGGSGTGGDVASHDAGSSGDASTLDGGDEGGDGRLVCTITKRFQGSCPASGCPAGTICVIQVGGVAGGGGEYCAPIPSACKATPTCSCLGECVCGPGFGMPPRQQACTEGAGGTIECDNGIR